MSNFRGLPSLFLQFPQKPGLYRITGVNEAQPALGSNGVGKTTLLDAISWALTGRTGGGITGPKVIAAGAKRAAVTLTFDGGQQLVRTQAPNSIQLNGTEIADKALESQLSTTHWYAVAHHAQGEPFFIDLSPTERATWLADWLRGDMWETLIAASRQAKDALDKELARLQVARSHTEGELAATERSLGPTQARLLESEQQAQVARKRAAQESASAKHRAALSETRWAQARLKLEQLEQEQQTLEAKKAPLLVQFRAETDLLTAIRQDRKNCTREWEKAQGDLDRLQQLTECTYCQQPVTEEHRVKIGATLTAAMQNLQRRLRGLSSEEATHQRKATELTEQLGALQDTYDPQALAEARRAASIAEVDYRTDAREAARDFFADAQLLNEQTDALRQELERLHQERAALANRLVETQAEEEALARRRDIWKLWGSAFGELRVWDVVRVVDHFNLLVNQYLLNLGMHEWSIQMKLSENRLQQRLDIEVFSPYQPEGVGLGGVSGGERQRLRIATQLAVGELAPSRWGVEYWDEPSPYLSRGGVEDVVECLRTHAQRTRTQVYLVDHFAGQFQTDGVLCLRKTTEGVTASW